MSTEFAAWLNTLPRQWQRRCIIGAIEILPTMPGVQAVWVAGSLARGEGDEFSDVDLNCLVSSGSIPFWREHWSDAVARCLGPLTLARTINDSIIGGFSLTDDWKHVDLILHPLTAFIRPADCRILHDPHGMIENAPARNEPDSPMEVDDMSEFFFYLAGNLATLIGRKELVLAQNAVISLRQWLVRLMLLENRTRPPGGARRLKPYLTPEQLQELEEAGLALGSLEEVSSAAAIVLDNFANRARRLAQDRATSFPDDLLLDTRRHLRRTLGPLWPRDAG